MPSWHGLHLWQLCHQCKPLPAPDDIFAPLKVVVDCCVQVFYFYFHFLMSYDRVLGDLLSRRMPSWHALHQRQHCQQYQPLPALSNTFTLLQVVVDCCDQVFYFCFHFWMSYDQVLWGVGVSLHAIMTWASPVTAVVLMQAPPSAWRHLCSVEGCGWLCYSFYFPFWKSHYQVLWRFLLLLHAINACASPDTAL